MHLLLVTIIYIYNFYSYNNRLLTNNLSSLGRLTLQANFTDVGKVRYI